MTGRAFATYQLPVDFVVCGGALVGVLSAAASAAKTLQEGGMEDDQRQRSSPTQTCNCWRQLLPNNAPL